MYNEVYDFLNILGKEYISLIPNKVYEFIQNNKIPDYETNIDYDKNISSQILDDTLVFISYLNLKYWCLPEEKDELIQIYKENDIKQEMKKKEKYNPDEIFKKKNTNMKEEKEHFQMIQYKESLWKKIINFFKIKYNNSNRQK